MVWIIESTTRWRGWGTVEPQWLCLMTPTCVGRPINFSHMSKPCVCISVCPHYLLQHSSKVFISVCQHYQLWCSLQVSGHLGMDISITVWSISYLGLFEWVDVNACIHIHGSVAWMRVHVNVLINNHTLIHTTYFLQCVHCLGQSIQGTSLVWD